MRHAELIHAASSGLCVWCWLRVGVGLVGLKLSPQSQCSPLPLHRRLYVPAVIDRSLNFKQTAQ